MKDRRLIVEPPPAPGAPPHVQVERFARWKLVGAAEADRTPEEVQEEFMFALRDQGIGPEPVVSYSDDGEGGRDVHLSWPDLGTHLLDRDYARLLALARLPVGREVPELDDQPGRDPEHEAEIGRVAAEDRMVWAFVRQVATAVGEVLLVRRRAERRLSRGRRKRR